MHWGHKIALSFTLFAAFIIYMVVRAFQVNIDLVTPDYYAQEIAFDSKMSKRSNFNSLGEKVMLEQKGELVVLTYPAGAEYDGEIHFYHPARKDFDQRFPIVRNEEGIQEITKSHLVKGLYRVNLTWTSDGKDYFQQENIFIQ